MTGEEVAITLTLAEVETLWLVGDVVDRAVPPDLGSDETTLFRARLANVLVKVEAAERLAVAARSERRAREDATLVPAGKAPARKKAAAKRPVKKAAPKKQAGKKPAAKKKAAPRKAPAKKPAAKAGRVRT